MSDNSVKTINISFSSVFEFMDTVHKVSDVILQVAGFDEDDRYWLTIAVREAITNAVKHGNKMDPEKMVDVSFRVDEEGFVVRVQDYGEGFDANHVPDPRLPENLLKDKGRGIYYIKSFMDEVSYDIKSGRGTTVTMTKSLPKSEGRQSSR